MGHNPKRKSKTDDRHVYDTSDVTVDIKFVGRREMMIILKSPRDFNLMRYYVTMWAHLEKLGVELGFLDDAEGEH